MTTFRRRSERPMNCRQVGRRLQRYLDGDLDDLTNRRVLHHLESCRRCGMEATVYTEIKASLARRRTVLPDDAVSRLRAFGQELLREGPPTSHDQADDSPGA